MKKIILLTRVFLISAWIFSKWILRKVYENAVVYKLRKQDLNCDQQVFKSLFWRWGSRRWIHCWFGCRKQNYYWIENCWEFRKNSFCPKLKIILKQLITDLVFLFWKNNFRIQKNYYITFGESQCPSVFNSLFFLWTNKKSSKSLQKLRPS